MISKIFLLNMDPSHLKKQVISFENYFKPIFSFKQYSIFSLTTGFWGQEGDLRKYSSSPKVLPSSFSFHDAPFCKW